MEQSVSIEMYLLPCIMSKLKVRYMDESSHEKLLIKICKKEGCIFPLEHSIKRYLLPSDNVVGLSVKALFTPWILSLTFHMPKPSTNMLLCEKLFLLCGSLSLSSNAEGYMIPMVCQVDIVQSYQLLLENIMWQVVSQWITSCTSLLIYNVVVISNIY